jgi:DNA ligase-1
MLAYQKLPDLEKLTYPLIASPKLDGIRCLIVDGVAVSRSLKPIRNKYIQDKLGRACFNGLDGELVVGEPTDPDVYLKTNSGVMSIEGEPDFCYLVFDQWGRTWPYRGMGYIQFSQELAPEIEEHEFLTCHTPQEVLDYEADKLAQGYEGLILRNPAAPYKFGRSTLKEEALLKLKRFTDAECLIVGVTEAFANDNEAFIDERGYTKRSQAQGGRTEGKGMIGSLTCRFPDTVETFEIGTFKGLTNEDKAALWQNRSVLPGKVIKFKYFEHGMKDLPRHGVFLGFRDSEDM